jgi:hypothetical protein
MFHHTFSIDDQVSKKQSEPSLQDLSFYDALLFGLG